MHLWLALRAFFATLVNGQTAARVRAVKSDISKVSRMSDIAELADAAGDVTLAPEARLLAERKCEAAFALATDERRKVRGVECLESTLGGAQPSNFVRMGGL